MRWENRIVSTTHTGISNGFLCEKKDRQIDRQISRHKLTDRQLDKNICTEKVAIDRYADRQIDRQIVGQMRYIDTDFTMQDGWAWGMGQTDGQTDGQVSGQI